MSLPERERIEVLLGVPDDPEATETEPDPSAAAIGAIAGIAYGWPDSAAKANVYVFDDYWPASEARETLTQSVDASTTIVRTTVNGSLLLWATAAVDDEAGQAHIEWLPSTFAGRE